MSVLDRIATRAMPQTTTSGRTLPGMGQRPTGNIVDNIPLGRRNARNGVVAGTANITFASPGQPLALHWDGASSVEAYYQSLWVMRCVRTIAETLAALPFMAGKSARNPNTSTLKCPLAYMLGPPPGSPNSRTTARALWAWTVCQYIVTGKVGWETQLDTQNRVIGLWPLVSPCLTPVPSMGGDRWWDSFQYQTPYGIIELQNENVMYGWRPSLRDWRQPESPLESARSAISMQVGIERFMNGLLKNGLTAAHMVISPPFEEPEMRRAWQEQFLTEFTGVDNAGKTIFGEAELSDKDQRIPQVQVQQIGTRPVDAQLLQMWQQAKIDVTVALGVPESLIGNASQRTYANADCLKANEYVRLANGERYQAKDLVGKTFDVLTTTPYEQIKRVEAYAHWNKVEPTYAVTTESGRRIMANDRHPLYAATYTAVRNVKRGSPGRPAVGEEPKVPRGEAGVEVKGWTPIGELKPGDLVAVPTELPYEGDGPLTVEEAAVLGAIVGDGCSTGTAITLTSPLGPDVEAFTRAVETLGDSVRQYKTREGACDQWGVSGGVVRKLLEDNGLLGVKARDKHVPPAVFAARQEVQVAFLQALYAADGCAGVSKPATYGGRTSYARAAITLVSISDDLVRDVQELLLRFGIGSRIIHQHSKGGLPYMGDRIFESYHLICQNPDEVVRFCDMIGIPAKAEAVKRAREVAAMPGRQNRRTWRAKNLWPGLMWEKVKSIEPAGIDATVGLMVPDGHTYLGTYWEHNTEYRNFWTITMSSFIGEMEDLINVHLAPRLGNEVGWFDVSEVVALQSPTIFAPLAADKAVDAGILTPKDVQDLLDIADLVSPAESIETAPLGEEGEGPSTQGYPPSTAPSRSPEWAQLEYRARQIAERRRAINWDKSTDIADKVHGYLARSYPRRTLSWVHDAAWTRKKVPLDSIQMERRPGGARDDVKVASMAKQIRSGIHMDPVVLVNSPADDKLRIADGYHRTLAHRHAGRGTIDAYVATPATAHGDWETEMHGSKKSSRALQLVDFALEDPERRTLLGLELRELAHTGPERPRTVKQIVGGPSTGAAPTKTVTIQVTEPVTPRPHAFKGHNLAMCTECEQPVLSPIHLAGFSDENRGPTYPLAVAP